LVVIKFRGQGRKQSGELQRKGLERVQETGEGNSKPSELHCRIGKPSGDEQGWNFLDMEKGFSLAHELGGGGQVGKYKKRLHENRAQKATKSRKRRGEEKCMGNSQISSRTAGLHGKRGRKEGAALSEEERRVVPS